MFCLFTTNCDFQEQEQRNNNLDSGKSLGDLNMKLKLEIGALRGENEGLQKKNEEVARQVVDLENQIQVGLRLDFVIEIQVFQ